MVEIWADVDEMQKLGFQVEAIGKGSYKGSCWCLGRRRGLEQVSDSPNRLKEVLLRKANFDGAGEAVNQQDEMTRPDETNRR